MRKLSFFFIVVLFSSLYGNQNPSWQVMEEYMCWYINSIREIRSEKPSRFWLFNNREYLLNDSYRWEPLGGDVPANQLEFIKHHAELGVCFKGHRGVYLDTRYYEEGVWYCRGQFEGKECPYHMNIQLPDGIPVP